MGRTLQPSHNFLTADRTFIPLHCCCRITPQDADGILRAMIREIKDGVNELEKNFLFGEMEDETTILVEEERMRRERRARGALRVDTGIVEQSVSVLGDVKGRRTGKL